MLTAASGLDEVIEVDPKHGELDRASKRIAEDHLTAVYASGEVTEPVLISIRKYWSEASSEADKVGCLQRHVNREFERVEAATTRQIEHEPGRRADREINARCRVNDGYSTDNLTAVTATAAAVVVG